MGPQSLNRSGAGEEDLFPGARAVVDWGLDRINAGLSELGDPHLSYPTLHVGGTNGKGSVASIWARCLLERGERTGLYTSPHLCSFAERIRIDGSPAPRAKLLKAARRLRPLVERLGMSRFEAGSLLAFDFFAREGVEVACVEVGLGGRLDATNVVRPVVSAITNVALDHQEYLGATKEAIAREKAGILKPGVPAATAEADPRALGVLLKRAKRVGAPLDVVRLGRDVRVLAVRRSGTAFLYRSSDGEETELRTPLLGEHQAINAAVALRALERIQAGPSRDQRARGLAKVSWPGRIQILRRGGVSWILDVAHNAHGARALADALDRLNPPRPRTVVAGVLGDKDWRAMLGRLVADADRSIFTRARSAPRDRVWDPWRAARSLAPGVRIEVRESLRRVIDEIASSGAKEGTVVVTGSCHTVGDALKALDACP